MASLLDLANGFDPVGIRPVIAGSSAVFLQGLLCLVQLLHELLDVGLVSSGLFVVQLGARKALRILHRLPSGLQVNWRIARISENDVLGLR